MHFRQRRRMRSLPAPYSVDATRLAVHGVGRPQGAVRAQLGGAAIDEGAVGEDDLIAIPRRGACGAQFHSCLPAADVPLGSTPFRATSRP